MAEKSRGPPDPGSVAKEMINDPETEAFLIVAFGPGRDAFAFSAQRRGREYEKNVRLAASAFREQMHDIDEDLSDFIRDVLDEVKKMEAQPPTDRSETDTDHYE